MRAKHGEAAEQILIEGAPHVMIFPNLFIAEIQVFNIQPVSERECVQYSTAVQLKGAPELNTRMVSQSSARWARRACCWPTTPRCTSATRWASGCATPEVGRHPPWRAPREHRRATVSRSVRRPTRPPCAAFWRNYKGLMAPRLTEGTGK